VTARAGQRLLLLALLVSSAAALGAAFPAVLRIPPHDPAAPRSLPAALFSHRGHQSLGCFGCHPSVFPQAPLGFTHDDMRAGRFCGHCHDGRTSFAIQGATCAGCHAPPR
jgi:c(7)-type cytochrome triheme protein